MLKRVFDGFARELWRERHESQHQASQERAHGVPEGTGWPEPPNGGRVTDGARKRALHALPISSGAAGGDPRSPGVPLWPWLPDEGVPGEVLLRMMRLAVGRALEDVPHFKQRSPGTVSRATRRALECLCLVYCRCHSVPRPTKNTATQIRNPTALEFAFDCLRAWCTPGIGRLGPADVIRSSGLNNN